MGRVTRFLQATQQTPESGKQEPSGRPDPELERVVAVWPTLPKHIKRTILTLVGAGGSLSKAE
jgi:hypothetical protein